MDLSQYINPKLLPGLTVRKSLDEPIIYEITNERADKMAPAMLMMQKEREQQDKQQGA